VGALEEPLRIRQAQINERVISALRWREDAGHRAGLIAQPRQFHLLADSPPIALRHFGAEKYGVSVFGKTPLNTAIRPERKNVRFHAYIDGLILSSIIYR